MTTKRSRAIAHYWNSVSPAYGASHPEYGDRHRHPSWGLHHLPERRLKVLDRVAGRTRRLVEFGCGCGHDALGFARLGFDVTAIDLAQKQIDQAPGHPRIRYRVGPAESTGLRGRSADVVVSDHGAFDHGNPARLFREAARILKRGGLLVVCTYTPLAFTCYDMKKGRVGRQLRSSYPGAALIGDGTRQAACLSYSAWFNHLHSAGFALERMEELLLPPGGQLYFDELVDAAWAERWPVDFLFVARKI